MEELKKSLEGLPPKEYLETIKAYKEEHIHHLRLSEMHHNQYEYEKYANGKRGSNGGNGLSKSTAHRDSKIANPMGGSRGSMMYRSSNMSGEKNRIKEKLRDKLKKLEKGEISIGSLASETRKIMGLDPIMSADIHVGKRPKGENGNGGRSSYGKRIKAMIIDSKKSDCEMHSDPESETTPLPYDLPPKRKNSRGENAKEYVQRNIEKHEKDKNKPIEIFINKKKSEQVLPASAKQIRLSAMNPSSPRKRKSPYGSPYGGRTKSVKQRNMEEYLYEREKEKSKYFKGIKARPVPSFIKKSRVAKSKKNQGNAKNKKPKPKPRKFVARSVPTTHQKSWSEIQEEQEKIRKERKKKRIEELRESSKLPPRMQMAEESSNRMSIRGVKYTKVKPLKRRENSTSAPRSRKRIFQHKPVPNFEHLQTRFEKKLQDARRSMPSTVSQPFRFGDGGKNISDAKMNKVLVKMERDRVQRGSTRWPHHPYSHLVGKGKPTRVPRPRRGRTRIVKLVRIQEKHERVEKEEDAVVEEEEEEEDVKSSEENEEKEESKTEVVKVQPQPNGGRRSCEDALKKSPKKPPFKKSFSESSVYEKERLTRSIKLQRESVRKKLEEREKQKKERKEFYRKLTRKRRQVGRKMDLEDTTNRLYAKEVARFRKRFIGRKKVRKKSRYDRMNYKPSKRGGEKKASGSFVLGKAGERKDKKRSARDQALEEIGVGNKSNFFDFYNSLHGEITRNSSFVVSDFSGKFNLRKNNIENIVTKGGN